MMVRSSPDPPVPVRFCPWGMEIAVLVTAANSRWARAAAQARRVSFSVSPSQWKRGTVRVVLENEADTLQGILNRFRERYGPGMTEKHFKPPLQALLISPDEVTDQGSLWRTIGREFDAAAPSYLDRNLSDPVDRYTKARSLERLRQTFRGRNPLLELGPGVGIETIPLLQDGHRVLAVDLSSGMLSQLRERAAVSGVRDQLETRIGALADLTKVLSDVPPGYFSGAFSTFGAFNLEPDLSPVSCPLARVLSPGSRLFLAVLNGHGVPPLLYSAIQGRMDQFRNRLRNPIPVEGVGYPLPLRPLTRTRLTRTLGPWFVLEKMEAVTVFTPTQYSPRLWGWTSPAGRARVARWDRVLSKHWPFREIGEWSFLTFRRTRLSS